METIVANAINAYIAVSSTISSDNTSDADESTMPSSTTDDKFNEKVSCEQDKSCRNENTPHKRLPFKKKMVLQWKDEQFTVAECQESVVESKSIGLEGLLQVEAGNSCLTPTDKIRTPNKQRESPPCSSMNLVECQDQLKKMERFVRSACEYELQLLNEAKSVREKRNRMVHRLKYMKLKVLRRTYFSSADGKNGLLRDCSHINGSPSKACPSFIDDFPLPPVFGQAPTISIRRQRQIDLFARDL